MLGWYWWKEMAVDHWMRRQPLRIVLNSFPGNVVLAGMRAKQKKLACMVWGQTQPTVRAEKAYGTCQKIENSGLTLSADVCHSERGTVTPSAVPSLRARMPHYKES